MRPGLEEDVSGSFSVHREVLKWGHVGGSLDSEFTTTYRSRNGEDGLRLNYTHDGAVLTCQAYKYDSIRSDIKLNILCKSKNATLVFIDF